MRPLERLLLLAIVMAGLSVSSSRLRAGPWTRHLPVLASLMAVAQVHLEGARWQLVPAYALAVLVTLAWIRQIALRWRRPVRQRPPLGRLVSVARGLGLLAFLTAVVLPLLAPVFRVARPSGPYAIGTVTYHWVDSARAEAFGAHPGGHRQLMVQIWYPAQANRSVRAAPYVSDSRALASAVARLHHVPAFFLDHLQYVASNAMPSVPVASDSAAYPVLVFLEGATGFRQMNTFQVEHLASNGYIIVAVDQPGVAATVVFPDGHEAASLTVPQFHAMVRPSYMPASSTVPPQRVLLPNGDTLRDRSIIPYLTQDVRFTLNKLAVLNRADPADILATKLDLQRIGIFGVSLGGIVAADACLTDARLRACLVMDAAMSAVVVKQGLRQPAMWITRDVASMRRERHEAGGWPEAEIAAHQASMRAAYGGLTGAGYFLQVPGMFHLNFTDLPTWTPLARLMRLSGPIDAARAHDIVNAYTLAFFDTHVRGHRTGLLDGPALQYPDVMFESRRVRSRAE